MVGGSNTGYQQRYNQFQACVGTAQQLVLIGVLFVVASGPIALIGALLIEIPPAALVAEIIALGAFVVGIALVLAGAIYYGIFCHAPT